MGKIKKFPSLSIRKLSGGKDPLNLVEEFILRLGHDPKECARERDADNVRWMITVAEDEELEILLESLRVSHETTLYMGINIAVVPLRGAHDVITTAMQIADGLVGIKVSLVGHYIVLSSTLAASGITVDELDYHYRLITAQQNWFRNALAEELGWEGMPEE